MPQIRGGLAWDPPQRRLYPQGPLGHVCTHFWLSPQLLARAAAQRPAAHRTAPATEPGLAQDVTSASDETPRAVLTPAACGQELSADRFTVASGPTVGVGAGLVVCLRRWAPL